jgi:hypothetical protein
MSASKKILQVLKRKELGVGFSDFGDAIVWESGVKDHAVRSFAMKIFSVSKTAAVSREHLSNSAKPLRHLGPKREGLVS